MTLFNTVAALAAAATLAISPLAAQAAPATCALALRGGSPAVGTCQRVNRRNVNGHNVTYITWPNGKQIAYVFWGSGRVEAIASNNRSVGTWRNEYADGIPVVGLHFPGEGAFVVLEDHVY